MVKMASQIANLTIVYSIVIQAQIKENIKAPRHWPLCGEFTGTGEFPQKEPDVSIWWRHQGSIHRFRSVWRSLHPCVLSHCDAATAFNQWQRNFQMKTALSLTRRRSGLRHVALVRQTFGSDSSLFSMSYHNRHFHWDGHKLFLSLEVEFLYWYDDILISGISVKRNVV